MVALAAQREGVSPGRYVRTRTVTELQLSVAAWVTTWSYPMRVLGEAFTGGATRRAGAGGAQGPHREVGPAPATSGPAAGLVPRWYRQKRGWEYEVHDLGPIKGEEAYDPKSARRPYSKADGARAWNTLASSFAAKSAMYGSGGGAVR